MMWSVRTLVTISIVNRGTDGGAYLISKYFTLPVSLPLNIGAIGSVGTVLHQDPETWNTRE